MFRVAKIIERVAHRFAKERPADLFKGTFYDIRERVKALKQTESEKAIVFLTKTLKKDLTQRGLKVISADLKLGKYRGSQFVTSAKLQIGGIPNEKQAEKLAEYLRQKYSPKFKLKSFADNTANYNIR